MNKFTGEPITTTLEFTEIDFSQRAMSCHRNSLQRERAKHLITPKNDDHNEFKPALHIKHRRLGYIWI